MEIENLVTERVGSFNGQRSSTPHATLQPSDAERVENFVTKKGRLRKIWGTLFYANPGLDAGEVKWLDYFRNRWIFQQGTAIGVESAENSSVFTKVGDILLGALNRITSEKWQSRIYMSNGVENRFFESNAGVEKYLTVGLLPPGLGYRGMFGDNPGTPPLITSSPLATGVGPIVASVDWSTGAALPANAYTAAGGVGNGDFLTASANGILILDDGALPQIGETILVKNEASTNNGGIYTVTATGDANSPFVLTRASYFCTPANMIVLSVIPVLKGANATFAYQIGFAGAITVGVTALTFTKVASAGIAAYVPYRYVLTWWDAVRRVESLPHGSWVGEDGFWNSYSPLAGAGNAITLTGADVGARVSITQFKNFGYDTDRVTHFILYRGTQDSFKQFAGAPTTIPTTFKRIADPDISDTADIKGTLLTIDHDFYDDYTKEESLGKLLDESLSPPPGGKYYLGRGDTQDVGNYGPRFVKLFRDSLWYFGVRFPGTIHGQRVVVDGSNIIAATYFPFSGFAYASDPQAFDYWKFSFDVGRASGQEDTGLAIHRNTLIFFKSASAYYLSGSTLDNYAIQLLDSKRGIVAPGSIQETTKGVIGLSADCFAIFDSVGGAKPISEEISDEVDAINLDLADKITSAFDPKEEKYECHVPVLNTYNTKVFIYDLKQSAWSFTTRAGASAAYGLSSNRRVTGLLGDTQNSRLYKTIDQSQITFNGQTILGSWSSKHFDFGNPAKLKSLQRVLITARAVRDFKLSIDVIPDFGDGDSVSIEDISPDVKNDDWNDVAPDTAGADWDEGQWGEATTKKKFSILVQCIGRNLQLVVRNANADANAASFEIEEIVLEASLLGGDADK